MTFGGNVAVLTHADAQAHGGTQTDTHKLFDASKSCMPGTLH